MIEKTAAELSQALANGEISSVELTQSYLDQIKKYNEELNSYITVCEESALVQAKEADKKECIVIALLCLAFLSHTKIFSAPTV